MKRLLLLSALVATGCVTKDSVQPSGVSSFRVTVKGITTPSGSANIVLPVVTSCSARFNGDDKVPVEVRGTADCAYVMPSAPVDIALGIVALDASGQPLTSFTGPVSFRVVPGDLSGDYTTRWTQLTNGEGTGKVRASHVYGEVRVWVADEAPEVKYWDGGIEGDVSQLPKEPETRTYATGLSVPIQFQEPTIAAVQIPQAGEQESAFQGSFLRIGRNPEAGPALTQNCAPDDPNNGKPVTLLVTGLDPSGFFVTDMTACRMKETSIASNTVPTPEPDGFTPGRFNSMFIYNYSFPEGLDQGDLLWTLSGSVQEFTSTTQLTFPAWSIREKVRLLPQAEWNKYLSQVPPTVISGRLCGFGASPSVNDALCGYVYKTFKMESLESSLVKLPRVKFPTKFVSCDGNGNSTLPRFCSNTGTGTWTTCFGDNPADPDGAERQCLIDCTLGVGQYANTICTEKSNYDGFSQFVVEMNPSGPAAAGLDESVPARIQKIAVKATPTSLTRSLDADTHVTLWCSQPTRVRFGGDTVTATAADTLIPANTLFKYKLGSEETMASLLRDATATADGTCQVTPNMRSRILLITKDAVPELVPNCSETDPNPDRAQQCAYLHAASFDVVGHLRHIGAARPRWAVIPRDQDDLCCYPGPNMQCPRPIKPCP
ncbi:hypothetical protein JGU66_21305 [Myxococcaceae bacterium JPH2]|nr:hypothetical protein [Myxococcaceae bacterium JPH2]